MIYSFGMVGSKDRYALATLDEVCVEHDVIHGYVTRHFEPFLDEGRLAVWPTGQREPVYAVAERNDPLPEPGTFVAFRRLQEQP